MHNTMFKIMIVILLLLAASGCGIGTTGGAGAPGTSAPVSTTNQPQGDTMETPERPLPSSQDGAANSPSGASSTPSIVSNMPGAPPSQPPADSGAPGMVGGAPGTISIGGQPASPAPDNAPTPTQWLTYTDQVFGFSISYPDTYVILDKPSSPETPPAGMVHQVRFQDKHLASGATADLEPPQFRIEVFDNAAGASLDQWLSDHQVTGTRTPAPIGKQQGVQVSLNTMMAPNQFYYLAHGSYIYRLTPLGQYGIQMLGSFTLQ